MSLSVIPPQLSASGIDDLQKFEAVFREIPAAIALVKGSEFIFEMANDDYCKLVGRSDIIGKKLLDALPELRDLPYIDQLTKVLTTGETYRAKEVEVFLGPSEEEKSRRVFVDFTYRQIVDRSGKPYGVFVFAIDVTEKVLARTSIQLEQVKLESVFKNATAALAIVRGPDAVYEKANASYVNLFNERPLIGRPLLEALPELKGQKFPDLIFNAYRTGENYIETEALAYLRRTSDGELEERYFDQSYIRIEDQDGKPYGVLIHAIDVTERVHARRKLEHALSARDTFLSIASHELKTPITGMRLQAQMMKRALDKKDANALSLARVQKLVDQTDAGLTRINRLVDDMLDISRISGGKLSLNCELTEFNSFVRSLIEQFSEELADAGISTEISSARDEMLVNIDRFRIEQVLTNLITNTIKYAARTPLSIALDSRDGIVQMIFHDHGPGIAQADQERIFERFERLVSPNVVSGMGLGLYIVRQIVLAHGGRIFAEAGSVPGARFVLELPQAKNNDASLN